MDGEMQDSLRVSERLYESLLSLYPVKFRTAHGWHMRMTFRDACWAAYSRGGLSDLLSLWLPTLFDLFKTAVEERARQGAITVSKDRFIGLAGPLIIIIGLLWMLASVGEFILLVKWDSPDTFWDVFWFFPVALSFFLMIPAFLGTRRRFQESTTSVGKLGLILSMAGGVGVVIFLLVSILLGVRGIEVGTWPHHVIQALYISPMIGHVLFGIDALRNKLLPHWNVMPLLVGLPSVLLFIPPLLVESNSPNLVEWVRVTTFLRFALTGIAWVLMGYAMLTRRAGPADVSPAVAHG